VPVGSRIHHPVIDIQESNVPNPESTGTNRNQTTLRVPQQTVPTLTRISPPGNQLKRFHGFKPLQRMSRFQLSRFQRPVGLPINLL
jgi:hypothetical protein